MDPTREKQLNDLLGLALAKPPGERQAFLEGACRDDASLAREAWSLLGDADELGSFLEAPADLKEASETIVADLEHLEHPERIGPYRIVELLGEGGMGRVFLAEQTEPVERRVALKLMNTGFRHPSAKVRFAAERQALARLSHPYIGQMLEAGTTERGYPYFVMELVRGAPITRYCDDAELGVEARLRLFIRVCEGVQHAHHKQILHRDLKPSNLLVAEIEGRAVPKIIDFGVAKALDRPLTDVTLKTSEGIVGTPSYMSPEALMRTPGSDDLDTRSDVYALGILLYELLTGVRPFETTEASLSAILRQIAEDDAPRPSSRLSTLHEETRTGIARRRRLEVADLRRRLTGDLDWIVLKAIAKDRQDRYGSPAELAADIERHLRDEPVEARAPSTLYVARKFVRRHRVGVAAAAAATLALVLGMIGTAAGWMRARQAEARALEDARTAEQVVDFLVELFENSDPSAARGADVTAREVLDRGLERIAGELADQPRVRARLLYTMGNVYFNLGLPDEAEPLLQEGLALRRAEGGEPAEWVESLEALSAVWRDQDRTDEAEVLLNEALEIATRLPGEDEALHAMVLHNLARLYTDQGRLDEARDHYRRSIEIRRRVFGPGHSVLANSWNNLGLVLTALEDYEGAEEALLRAIEIHRSEHGDDHPDLADSYSNLGAVYYRLGRLDDALVYIERDLEISRKVLSPGHPNLGISYNNVATLKQALGDFEGSLAFYEKALRIAETTYGAENPETWSVLNNMAALADRQGDLRRALELHERVAASALRRRPDHPQTAVYLLKLGTALVAECSYDRAETVLRQALETVERTDGRDHVGYGSALFELGALNVRRGRFDSAALQLSDAQRIFEARLGAEDPRLLAVLRWRARLHMDRDDPEAARRELLSVLGRRESSRPARLALARVEASLGLYDEARGRLDGVVEGMEQELAERPGEYRLKRELAVAYLRTGVLDEAAGELDAARGLYTRVLEVSGELAERFGRPDARVLQARALFRLGRVSEGRRIWRALRSSGCRDSELEELVRASGI